MEEIGDKCLQPENDSVLLRVVIGCKSLISQVLLPESEEREITWFEVGTVWWVVWNPHL
jgi:hypothetical protein